MIRARPRSRTALVRIRAANEAAAAFFFQAEGGIRDGRVTGVQTCALPISPGPAGTGLAGTAGPEHSQQQDRGTATGPDQGAEQLVRPAPARRDPKQDQPGEPADQ